MAFDQLTRTAPSPPDQRTDRRQEVEGEALADSPRVQSQLQLQRTMDASPRVVAQAKFADAINGGRPVVQRQGSDEEEDEENDTATDEDKEIVESSEDDDDETTVDDPILQKVREFKERLVASTLEKPLEKKEIDEAAEFLKKNRRKIPQSKRTELDDLIRDARSDAAGKKKTKKREKKPKRKRSGEESAKRKMLRTFENESGSELSDVELDPDKRSAKYPRTMAPITNRSHVPSLTDKRQALRDLSTGLPPADTYLGLFRGTRLVPRMINQNPNVKAHRRKMREVEGRFKERLTKARSEEMEDVLRDEVRPHIESVLFGSSLRPTDEDVNATKSSREKRTAIANTLFEANDVSGVGGLARPRRQRGLTSMRDTGTHAEQSLLDTRTWTALLGTLVGAITTNKEKPEELQQSETSVDLVLNRSTCIGCARALTMELVRFWQMVAAATGLEDWRAAKLAYEDFVTFSVTFPAIYEIAAEKKANFRNLERIIAGLQDAGWQVRINTGISSGSAKSDKANASAKELVAKYTAVPRYYARKWTQDIVRFPIPEELKKAVQTNNAVIINGVAYSKVKGADSLSRDPEQTTDTIDATKAGEFHFHETGKKAGPDTGSTGGESTELQSKVAKVYASRDISEQDPDPELQQKLKEGWTMQNVSGRGMNCLIRALFRAAGIRYDEAMVTIVRRYLIDLGVAVNADMLDLLGVEGDSLIHFLQAQGVLPANTGVTVHFPGNSMVVVDGANQIHLWYENNHFQAIVPPS